MSTRSYSFERGTKTSFAPRRRSSSSTNEPRNPAPPVTTTRSLDQSSGIDARNYEAPAGESNSTARPGCPTFAPDGPADPADPGRDRRRRREAAPADPRRARQGDAHAARGRAGVRALRRDLLLGREPRRDQGLAPPRGDGAQ